MATVRAPRGAAMGLTMRRVSFLLLLALCVSVACAAASPNLQILKADRKIDLTTQVVRISTTLKIENAGPESTSEVLLAFNKAFDQGLAFLRVTSVEGTGKKKGHVLLPVTQLDKKSNGNALYSVRLDKPLAKDGTVNLEVFSAHTHLLKPFPEEITQSEAQLVLFHESAHLLSPYRVKFQTTLLKLASSRVESYTKLEGSKHSDRDREIRYGPYEDVAAFSFVPITVHYENNEPFAVVKTLEREFEVSHWGCVSVTEKYHLVHDGARHNGVFSRFEYQSKPSTASGPSSFRHLVARLPPRLHSVYYRDEIGNISTSHLRSDLKKSELELEPRYPLFGGWQVTFTIGYGIPLEDFMFKSNDGRRYLNITFGSPFMNVIVDELTVKVVLPEGAKDTSFFIPFQVDQEEETKYTYLDTVGRPVLVLKKQNVVPEHNVYFQVFYRFTSLAMLAEPLLLVTGFFAIFAASIAYMHWDFSISKSSAAYQARAQREETLHAIQLLQKIFKTRAAVSERLEASLRDLARTGDVTSAKAVRKSADVSLKESGKELKGIYDSLPPSSRSTLLAKLDPLIQKEREMQERLQVKHTVTVEAYEKKLSSKEIDSRVAPHQQRLKALKQEVSELLRVLDD